MIAIIRIKDDHKDRVKSLCDELNGSYQFFNDEEWITVKLAKKLAENIIKDQKED